MILKKSYLIEDNLIQKNTKYFLNEIYQDHDFDFLYIDLEKILSIEDNASWNSFTSSIPKEDIYTSELELDKYGIESDKHISLVYGILPSKYNLKLISQCFRQNEKSIDITFKNISFFQNKDRPYDVMKFDIESEGLEYYYTQLLNYLEITNESDVRKFGYHPHATIAYLNKNNIYTKYFFEYQLKCLLLEKTFEVHELTFRDIYGKESIITI